MNTIQNYGEDGANYQAKAVLAYLSYNDGIEESWNDECKRYDAEIRVSRWENCREQGYVCYMRSENHKQLNIAFFEHRNTDGICAVMWEQNTLNAPTIDNAKFGDIYKDKFDVSHDEGYGKANEMAEWVLNEFTEFWTNNTHRSKDAA